MVNPPPSLSAPPPSQAAKRPAPEEDDTVAEDDDDINNSSNDPAVVVITGEEVLRYKPSDPPLIRMPLYQQPPGPQVAEEEEPSMPVVDDLMVAAAYAHQLPALRTRNSQIDGAAAAALATPVDQAGEALVVPEDEHEIDLGEEEEDDDHQGGDEIQSQPSLLLLAPAHPVESLLPSSSPPPEATRYAKGTSEGQVDLEEVHNDKGESGDENHDDDDDDDDVSEVDLSQELAQMVADDEDVDEVDEGPSRGSRRAKSQEESTAPLQTAHEIDPYQTQLLDLQRYFSWTLTLQEEDRQALARMMMMSATTGPRTTRSPPARPTLPQAGTLAQILTLDRTLVIQSIAHGTMLQEGSLLVVYLDDPDPALDPNTRHSPAASSVLVPLGKILEVFGPITQPWYSIRLPDTPKKVGVPLEIPTSRQLPNNSLKIKPSATQESHVAASAKASPGADLPSEEKEDKTAEEEDDHQEEPLTNSPPQQPVNSEPLGQASCEANVPTQAQHLKQGPKEEDPWGVQGRYTKLLKVGLPVYYAPLAGVHAVLDPQQVYRMTGRGCDASNLYDEEVTQPQEQDFSDDEQERLATASTASSSRSGKGRRRHQPPPQPSAPHRSTAQHGRPRPTLHPGRGSSPPFHPSQPAPHQGWAASVPSGFHPGRGPVPQHVAVVPPAPPTFHSAYSAGPMMPTLPHHMAPTGPFHLAATGGPGTTPLGRNAPWASWSAGPHPTYYPMDLAMTGGYLASYGPHPGVPGFSPSGPTAPLAYPQQYQQQPPAQQQISPEEDESDTVYYEYS